MSKSRTKKIIIVLALTTIAYFYWGNDEKPEVSGEQYVTRVVDRSDIVQTISANGTLTPVVLVNVGTQVSGTVYKLHVDFNDEVEIDQVLAELDPTLLKAQLEQSKANKLSAKTALRIAKNKLKRHHMLKENGFISDEAMDVVEQEAELAQAQYEVSKAQVIRDDANLNYSIIKSPISGVVIARDIDIGQTVAANFQTPILFQIAKDLSQMQINISVAEADIGQLHISQQINFTVDAYLDSTFTGTVKQVRLNPTIQENVVTYNVIAMVSNDDGMLLPGMTANIHFVVAQKTDALRVPNAALRYQPKDAEAVNLGGPTIYQVKDGLPTPLLISTGITDGNFTEITDGDIKAGDSFIVRDASDDNKPERKLKFRMF